MSDESKIYEGAAAKQPYSAPSLTDYGKMSELTQALAGPGTGDDGDPVPSSYSTPFS